MYWKSSPAVVEALRRSLIREAVTHRGSHVCNAQCSGADAQAAALSFSAVSAGAHAAALSFNAVPAAHRPWRSLSMHWPRRSFLCNCRGALAAALVSMQWRRRTAAAIVSVQWPRRSSQCSGRGAQAAALTLNAQAAALTLNALAAALTFNALAAAHRPRRSFSMQWPRRTGRGAHF